MSKPQDKKALKRIIKARTALVLDQPFFGALALRLKLQEATHIGTPDGNVEALPTAGVDGRSLYYNPNFINGLRHDQLIGLLAHEVIHCSNGHPWRRGARDPKRWNVACDAAINPLLDDAGMALPDDGVRPKDLGQPNGKSAEWYHSRVKMQKGGQCQCGDGDGQGDGDSQSGTCPKCGGQRGDKDGNGNGDDPGQWGKVLDAPGDGHTDATTEADWQQATQSAANAAKMRGKLPAALERYASISAQASVDWRSVLRRFVQQSTPTDYSWSRPNRRYVVHGVYLPKLNVPSMGPLLVAVDTSGSIDQVTLDQFFGEINAIVQDAKPTQVDIMYCDAAVQGHDTFYPGDPIEAKPRGGGGTAFEPVFDKLDDLEQEPVCIIYLTDMYGSFPNQPPNIPTLWASITRDKEAPFGETVYIDS